MKGSRKSIESKTNVTTKGSEIKNSIKSKAPNTKITKVPPKTDYSSEEDDAKKTTVKRKSKVKPKSSATITPKSNNAHSAKPNSRTKSPGRASGGKAAPKGKEPPPKLKTTKAIKSVNNKKKSIFSPENSSESETPKISKVNKTIQCKQKPELRAKAAARTSEKNKSEKNISDLPPKNKENTGMSKNASRYILVIG